MRRHRPPTLVSMWMLDVFCCALGCVTLLWLLKTREAGRAAEEAASTSATLSETRSLLDDKSRESAARMIRIEELNKDIEELKASLALMKQQRDEEARRLALVREELDKTKEALVSSRSKVEDLDKSVKGLEAKATTTEAELAKKRADLDALAKSLASAKKDAAELDVLAREREKARTDAETKLKSTETRMTDAEARLKESERKLDAAVKVAAESSKSDGQLRDLQKQLADQKRKIDDASAMIIDLQGTKAKLADQVNRLQIETENKFSGVALTGKKVVFLVDMSGSMDRVEENVLDPTKWGVVRETVAKLMRSLTDLDQFQLILFSSRPIYPLEQGKWIPYEKEKSIERVVRAMAAIKPAGDTNLYLAIEEAFKLRSQGLDTIYLFSDGLPTSGPGLTTVQDRTLTDADRSMILSRHLRTTLKTTWNKSELSSKRVRINSIGFFYESPDVGAFLWALSRENDGNFVGLSRP